LLLFPFLSAVLKHTPFLRAYGATYFLFDLLGEGGASLLKAIKKYGSISEAARRTRRSYKYAWDQIADIEKMLGQPILRTSIGGATGGGASLTEAAMTLLRNYERTRDYLSNVLKDKESWEAIGLKISARNQLKGIVEEVEEGSVVSRVKIRIQAPAVITAVITKERERKILEADTIITALPLLPTDELLKILEGKVAEIYQIYRGKQPCRSQLHK
jgi:molybdate transport system regulatory protein